MNSLEKYKNKLIVLEGSDSCSKTSVGKLFVDYLNNNNIPTIFTFQPGDSTYGTHAVLMRSLCKDKRYDLHPLANFFCFQLDRVEQTSKVIQPALDKGFTVISDRWNYSSFAYQLYGQQLLEKTNMPKEVAEWLLTAASVCREPDMTFYFPIKINSNRKDDPNDNFDGKEKAFFDRVNSAYEELASRYNWTRVMPGSSAEETLKNIVS